MKLKRVIAGLLCGVLCVSSFTACEMELNTNTTETELIKVVEAETGNLDEKKALLQEAFIYTLPLVIMDATYTKATNTEEANSVQAPVNQFFHAENLAAAESTDVVTPNVDTVYSQVFLDVSEDAVILEFPQTDRFCTVEVLDAYTNCVTIIDTTQFENEMEQFIFTGKDFAGEIPEGMTQVACPTAMAWVIVRTICDDEEDLENVYEIQDAIDAYTLTQYEEETTDEKPSGTFDENNEFIPVQHVQQMSMADYFAKANELMAANAPAEADEEVIQHMAEINVGPGLTFDAAVFGDEADAMWSELMSNIAALCLPDSQQYMIANGCWSYYGEPIAEFGTAYAYRALISLVGLGANPVSVAVYPKATTDSNGGLLNGANQYVLHFESDQLPPVEENGFWSVTAYNSSDNLLIDNELDRYCINDRSDVVYNDDGSLDIYIQSEAPEDDSMYDNWLPVASEDFYLVLRIYLPGEDVIHNVWPTPTILNQSEETAEETVDTTAEETVEETIEESSEE